VTSSHALDRWLVSRAGAFGAAGVTATTGRAPVIAGSPAATWISFETPRSTGRLVLWSTGRCQVDASSKDGTRLCATERKVTGSVELDDALTSLTEQLGGFPRR
jgi:hypothetical protein